ncbi:hypothetical protein [Actinoplanes sp. NPDC051859]
MTHPPRTEPETARAATTDPGWAVLCLRIGTALFAASAMSLGLLTVLR